MDDDAGIRDALGDLLEGEGRSVTRAGHGAEALAMLREGQRPCLILLDLMMPVMDGWSFLEALRDDPDLRDLPVVVISADHRQDAAVRRLGARDYLTKPIELNALITAIDHHCA